MIIGLTPQDIDGLSIEKMKEQILVLDREARELAFAIIMMGDLRQDKLEDIMLLKETIEQLE